MRGYDIGRSLGRQLREYMPALLRLAEETRLDGKQLWFLGRDCDVFYQALTALGVPCRYLVGLNRENAAKLQHRRKLCKWLRSIGVRDLDVLVDSGFAGSIFDRIRSECDLVLKYQLMSSNGAYPTVNEALNDESHRHVILALEHMQKSEVCSWDEEKRVPRVRKADPELYEYAQDVMQGMVYSMTCAS